MENIKQIKDELFKDFTPDYEINDYTPVYIIKLCGDFNSIVNRFDINIEYQRELYTVLPKDVLTLGYICRGCGTWMSSTPKSLCNMCEDNYREDLYALEEYSEDETAREWVEYYSSREGKEMYILFRTKSEADLESIRNNFKPLKYIKEISINKDCSNFELDGQYDVIPYKDMYLIDGI